MRNLKLKNWGTAFVCLLWFALAAYAWFGPRTDISESERRKLEQFPQLTGESLLTGKFMSKFEDFTQDQFPMRDRFRQAKAVFSNFVLKKSDNNGIYLADGYAAKLEYPLNEASVQRAVKKFTDIYQQYLEGSAGKIVFSVVPDKGYYLAGKHGYPTMDYEAMFAAFRELPWAEYADLTDCLEESCYYTTDTHWRQEELVPAARKLWNALDAPERASWDYSRKALERPFYGVYYGQAALPMEPERISVLENDVTRSAVVTNFENGQQTAVYDLDKLGSRDLYDVFLSGPVSVLEIQNPLAQSDRELIVFRDSFGSSIVPLLLDGYSKVTLLDIRYVPTAYLPQFVDFHGQDVLFLYSTLVLNQSSILK